MRTWWRTWGNAVLAVGAAIGSAIGVYSALEQRLDQIALRLQRIEIVLGIDPLTKDVLRTVDGR